MMPNKIRHQPDNTSREADKQQDHKMCTTLLVNTFIPQFIFFKNPAAGIYFLSPVENEEWQIRK